MQGALLYILKAPCKAPPGKLELILQGGVDRPANSVRAEQLAVDTVHRMLPCALAGGLAPHCGAETKMKVVSIVIENTCT